MQLSIHRQIYVAAIISLMLFGLVQTQSVRGSELLTETIGEETAFEPTPGLTPGLMDRVLASAKASAIGQIFFSIEPAPAPASVDSFEGSLHQAILHRIGIPYRSGGIDDSGYDCSGFVWRVFQAAGVNFKRGSARTYWETLPKATAEEQTQFGTLVFFDNSSHVGVVRDAYSFYHASSSQGVTRSNYSDYWGEHVRGFRRIPVSESLIAAR